MLTNEEREWVRENKTLTGCIYARRCRHTCFEPPYCPVIPTKEDLIDAAEFSERVATKLAEYAGRKVDVDQCFTCPAMDKNCHWGTRLSCEELMLQAARIEIEEEMDGKA